MGSGMVDFRVNDSIDGYSGEHPLTPKTIRAITQLIADARLGDCAAVILLPRLRRKLYREKKRAEADLQDSGRVATALSDIDKNRLADELDHLDARIRALQTLLRWIEETSQVSDKNLVAG